MNKSEYYKHVCVLLRQWKSDNNYDCKCVAHHRDDTEECRKYNQEHYELWGHNLDGTFEYGKYLVFMTLAEHSSYHNSGSKNSFFGKHHTDEQRSKWSSQRKGRKLTDEWKLHISENNSHVSGMKGKHHSEATRQLISNSLYGKLKGVPKSDETRRHMSEAKKGKRLSPEHKQQMKNTFKALSYVYNIYKQNGGILKWNDFTKELKNGNISFNNETPFSVFINR